MTRLHLSTAFLLAALAGCGQTIPPEVKTPHDGTLVALPEGQGYAEVLKRPDPSREGQTQVVVYFLDASRKPMKTPPTSARLKSRARGAAPIDLAAAADTSLASPGIPDPGELDGMLSTTLGGKEVTVPIRVR